MKREEVIQSILEIIGNNVEYYWPEVEVHEDKMASEIMVYLESIGLTFDETKK